MNAETVELPKPVKVKVDEKAVYEVIVEHFMDHGEDATVAELAAALKCSESTVRKVLNACHGVPKGCVVREEHRESYSKNYTNMQAGSHKVNVYGPSRATLRDLAKKFQRALDWRDHQDAYEELLRDS